MSGEKNLKIVSELGSFDVKLENLSGKAEPRKINGKEIEMKSDGTPKIYYRTTKGKDLTFCRVLDGKPIGQTTNGYINDRGELAQDKLPYYKASEEYIPAIKNQKTDVFQIKKWEDVSCFNDKYIIDKYYQVKPAVSSKIKQDYQRVAILNANTTEMKKIYDYMMKHQKVGRGTLNITSSGYLPSIAYLRAVRVNGKCWTLEIGVFKGKKRFTWVEEMSFKPKKAEQAIIPEEVLSIDEI